MNSCVLCMAASFLEAAIQILTPKQHYQKSDLHKLRRDFRVLSASVNAIDLTSWSQNIIETFTR